MNGTKRHGVVFVFLFLVSILAFSQEKFTENDKQSVERFLRKSLGSGWDEKNIDVVESNIDGFLEVFMQDKPIYFNIHHQLFFIGEIYDKNGVSQTKISIHRRLRENIKNLPSIALVIKNRKNKNSKKNIIIEFTDPDCTFCQQANNYLSLDKNHTERHIYFDTRIHPDAKKKVIHILCSKNKEEAFRKIYLGTVLQYEFCKTGEDLAKQHLAISENMHITGTPTFIIGDHVVYGFNKRVIEGYLLDQK